MKRIALLLGFALSCSLARAQQAFPCSNASNFASVAVTASTQLIAVPAASTAAAGVGKSIKVCAFTIQVAQTATPVNFGLTSGTGAACATGNALVTPAFIGVASTSQSVGQALANTTISLPPNTALCLTLSGAPTGAVAHIIYTIQ